MSTLFLYIIFNSTTPPPHSKKCQRNKKKCCELYFSVCLHNHNSNWILKTPCSVLSYIPPSLPSPHTQTHPLNMNEGSIPAGQCCKWCSWSASNPAYTDNRYFRWGPYVRPLRTIDYWIYIYSPWCADPGAPIKCNVSGMKSRDRKLTWGGGGGERRGRGLFWPVPGRGKHPLPS